MNHLRAVCYSILLGCIALYASTEGGTSLRGRSTRDLSVREQYQVHTGLALIRKAGYANVAKQMTEMMDSGKIVASPTLLSDTRGETTFSGFGRSRVLLNPSMLFVDDKLWTRRNNRVMSGHTLQSTILIASTLVHEWWHNQKGYVWTATHPTEGEKQAWTFELEFLKALRGTNNDARFLVCVNDRIGCIECELSMMKPQSA